MTIQKTLHAGTAHSPDSVDDQTRNSLQARIDAMGPWFYDIDLPGGLKTRSKVNETHAGIHSTRRSMLENVLSAHFGTRLSRINAIDLGCHEGYFSFVLRSLGIPEVLGIDLREDNLSRARLLSDLSDVAGLNFQSANCEDLDQVVETRFDLTLMFGFLYHQENPIRCLRQAAKITKELLIIETQVVDEIKASAEWGRKDCVLPYDGHFALIDETEFGDNIELGATALALCPSPDALKAILRHLGFSRFETLRCPTGGNEQLERGKRIVVVALRDA